MKRTCLSLMLILALTLTVSVALASGWTTPSDIPHDHFAWCETPTVCMICGESHSDINIMHHYSDYKYNATNHWQECIECGVVIWESTHWAWCDMPNVCAICGGPYSGDSLAHESDGSIQHDAKYHWSVCAKCGVRCDSFEHYAYCGAPGVCVVCGATGEFFLDHRDVEFKYDAKTHWQYCNECGTIIWGSEEHYIRCDGTPGACALCGYKGDIQNVSHNWYGEYGYDEKSHYEICGECGEAIWGTSSHRAKCDKPDTCATCGYKGKDLPLEHRWEGDIKSDKNYHYDVCADCGETLSKSTHYADCQTPGVCDYCGYKSSNLRLNHVFGEVKSDATYHYDICSKCREIIWQGTHYAFCANPGVCEYCGAKYTGTSIEHVGPVVFEKDDRGHWVRCTDCGVIFDRYTHSTRCDGEPGVCEDCGYKGENVYPYHNWSSDYEIDEQYHYSYCSICGELDWRGEHYANCDEPDICNVCGADYDGDELSHFYSGKWEYNSKQHWMKCSHCDEYSNKPEDHYESCFNPDGLCDGCGQPIPDGKLTHSAIAADVEHNGTYHWYECFYCGESVKEKHYTASWGKKGTCTLCGVKYANASGTDGDEEEELPEEDLVPVIGEEGDSFLSRFMENSEDAAAGDLLSGEHDVTLTIEATDEAHCEGSVLNVYRAGSRNDGVIIALESKYDAGTMLSFEQWQSSMTGIDELRSTGSFTSYVELAEALVKALMPNKTADEVDALIVALLQSSANLGDLDIDLGDDIDGEILGYLVQDGYEFFLVKNENSIKLIVREAV